MAHLVVLNLVFFIVPTAGSVAFALLVYRFVLCGGDPPAPPDAAGGTKVTVGLGPCAGPDDLARSA